MVNSRSAQTTLLKKPEGGGRFCWGGGGGLHVHFDIRFELLGPGALEEEQ